MARKVVIGLDLDNTFADFSGALRKFVADASGMTEKDVIDSVMPNPTGYSMENWAWEHTPFAGFSEAFSESEKTGYLYSSMNAFDNAVEAVDELSELGYDVHVVTARNARFENETREALENWGVTNIDKLTFTDKKYLYPADIFIDDAPSHLKAFGERNIPSVAFTNAYNTNLDDKALNVYGRISNWGQAVGVFQNIRATL